MINSFRNKVTRKDPQYADRSSEIIHIVFFKKMVFEKYMTSVPQY